MSSPVEWVRLDSCAPLSPPWTLPLPGTLRLGPPDQAPVEATGLETALRQGSLLALTELEGGIVVKDPDGCLCEGVGVLHQGPATRVRRSPGWAAWEWKTPRGRLVQSLLLSSQPAVAVMQWQIEGEAPSSDADPVQVRVPSLADPAGEPTFELRPGEPTTLAVWRPPTDPSRRRILERLVREPAALWKRWSSRANQGVVLDGCPRVVEPLGLALTALPTAERGRFWIGAREGTPVEGVAADRWIVALALAAVGRFQDSAVLDTAPSTLSHWTGAGDASTDPGENPLTSADWPWSPETARAIRLREAGDIAGSEAAWGEVLDQGRRQGGWSRPGWLEHGGEAAATVAHFVYDILGARPDAAVGRLRLAPAFPSFVDRLRVEGMSVGAGRLAFEYRNEEHRRVFRFSPSGGSTPLNVVLEPVVPSDRIDFVEVDGRVAEVGLEPVGDGTRIRLQLPLEMDREVAVVTV